MKNLAVLFLTFGSVAANAVSGPAYQNLAKMNSAVQAVVRLEESSDDLLTEADELEVTRIKLMGESKFEVITSSQSCAGDIELKVVGGGVGTNPTYVSTAKCTPHSNGYKAVQWSTIQAKIIKRANSGKVTSLVEVNQVNRRLKFK